MVVVVVVAAGTGDLVQKRLVKGDALETQTLGDVFHDVVGAAPVGPRPVETVHDCHRLSTTAPDFLRLPQTFRDCPRLSTTAPDYPRLHKTFHDCPRLSTIASDCPQMPQTIHDRPRLSTTGPDCSRDRSRLSRLPAVLKALTMKAAFGLDGRFGSSGVLGLTNVYISQ